VIKEAGNEIPVRFERIVDSFFEKVKAEKKPEM
jgi:hypothetical protein